MSRRDDSQLRSDVLTEFLEVAFHTILYHRGLYPPHIFVLRKKYQIPVRVTNHPKVNEYLSGCLKTIRELLAWNSVKEVALVVLLDEAPVERYVFAIELKTTPPSEEDEYLVAVEEMFRQFLLKLTVDDGGADLPPEATFAVHVITNHQSYVRFNENPVFGNFPWVQVDEGRPDSRRIVPIKTSECSLFKLNTYVER